jgi:endonuclease/exonuclease/phosphatase family metal-dependent hydrolase
MEQGFTVMTYNVGNGLAPPRRLAAVLRRSDADVIGLQELTPPQADAIDRYLAARYPFRALYGEGIPGKGLLSRYPILEAERLSLDPDRPDLRVAIAAGGKELTVIVAHPAPPRRRRFGWAMTPTTRAHVAALAEHATANGPTVLLGDFNLLSLHPSHRSLRSAGLSDAYLAVGRGLGRTHPRRIGNVPTPPFWRIDYIWYTRHLAATRVWAGPDGGSDHVPVLAHLRWNEA